jgi:hypothetical protein
MSDNFYRINRGLSLNPRPSAPSNPTNGDIYYDAVQKTFIFYDNGFWINLSSRVDVPSATSLNSTQLTLAVVQNSLVRVTGSTTSNLYGLAASTDGKQVVLYNQSSSPLIIANQSGSEPTAANRIVTFNSGSAAISAGQTAVLVYDSGQSRWILASSPGSGSGTGINYITNSDAEAGTTGWALYNNAAQNIPNSSVSNSGGGTAGSGTKAFGPGGGVNNLTFAASAVAPLRGNDSFLLTKSAAAGPPTAVIWSNFNSAGGAVVTVTGDLVQKTTGGGNARNASGYAAVPGIPGNGYFEFTTTAAGAGSGSVQAGFFNVIGFTYADLLTFGFSLVVGGQLDVVEGATTIPAVSTWTVGDVLRIAIESGIVIYRKNGTIVHTGSPHSGTLYPSFALSVLNSGFEHGMYSIGSGNAQGEGVSFPFTIDSADEANVLGISFNYNASASMNVSDGITAPLNDGTTTTNAGNSDIEVFIVDVTNNVLIPVTPEVITAKGANNFTFNGFFQTAPNSTSYILAFHVASSSATGWTFQFDNVVVGPQNTVQGIIPKASTEQVFLSSSGTYTTPANVLYIKVTMLGGGGGGGGGNTNGTAGSNGSASTFHVTGGPALLSAGFGGGGGQGNGQGGGVATSSLGSGPVGVALAGGSGADGLVAQSAASGFGGLGGSSAFGGAGIGAMGGISSTGGDGQPNTGGGGGGGTSSASNIASGAGGGSGGFVEAIINNPAPTYDFIVGTGGTFGLGGSSSGDGGDGGSGIIIVEEFYSGTNFSMSSSGSTNGLVALGVASIAGNIVQGGLVTDTFTDAIFVSIKTDTKNAYNTSTGVYTIPVSGIYEINALVGGSESSVHFSSGNAIGIVINRNGVTIGTIVTASTASDNPPFAQETITYPLIAGDLINVRYSANTWFAPNSPAYGFLNIHLLQGGAGTVAFGRQAPTVQKFTAAGGPFTYITPDNVLYIKVKMVGGGGGGGASGTTVGMAGGNTTFGSSLLVASGGAGGSFDDYGGGGGSASLGSGPIGIALSGGEGGGAGVSATSGEQPGGIGGSSAFGGAGSGGGGHNSPGHPGNANTGAGGGGGGATISAQAGTGGGSGGYVEAIINSPSATYSYSVGAGGAGGTPASGGSISIGGDGGSGIIFVEEYYQ